MVGLYRHECSECGNVEINDTFEMRDCPACDNKYAGMMLKPSPEHDKKIMEAPSSNFECPDCGEKLFALSNERGTDWMCRQTGGCGFSGWRRENENIRAPESFSDEEHARHNAWSRYQRYKAGYFEYRE